MSSSNAPNCSGFEGNIAYVCCAHGALRHDPEGRMRDRMRSMLRTARGPNRAPGRFETPKSMGTPSTRGPAPPRWPHKAGRGTSVCLSRAVIVCPRRIAPGGRLGQCRIAAVKYATIGVTRRNSVSLALSMVASSQISRRHRRSFTLEDRPAHQANSAVVMIPCDHVQCMLIDWQVGPRQCSI